ncbi:MAG: hypothetical protein WCA22_19305 [Candidatus Binatus sp.]
MDRKEFEGIETEERVTFSLNDAWRIVAEGPEAAVDRALARIAPFRLEVAEVLRERQGLPKRGEEIVRREVSANVPSKEVQRANYIKWFSEKGMYYRPSEQELDAMFAQVNEGDEIFLISPTRSRCAVRMGSLWLWTARAASLRRRRTARR